MLDQVFASLATGFAAQFGAPFVDAVATWTSGAGLDDGGSIVTPATLTSLPCKAQFDAPTQVMRQAEGFLETDARVLVLSASLNGVLDTEAKIIVATGFNVGTWALLSCVGDPANIGYECRGRKL